MSKSNSSGKEQQNIAEFVEQLKQSYGSEGESSEAEVVSSEKSGHADLSESELKEMLRMQFMNSEEDSAPWQEDSYYIDEDFLEEAELEEAPEELEEDLEEAPEELEEDFDEEQEEELEEELEEDFEEAPEAIEEDLVAIEEAPIDEDDMTFDDIVEVEDDDGVTYTKIELDDESSVDFLDDDITFEDLETFEEGSDELVLTRLELEPEEPSIVTIIERATPDYFKNEAANTKETELVSARTYVDEELPTEYEKAPEPTEDVSDFLSEFFSQDTDNTATEIKEDQPIEAAPQNYDAQAGDDADLSLLMQFGCEGDVLSSYSKETADEQSENGSVKEHAEKLDEAEFAENIKKQHNEYSKKRGAILLRLILTSVCAAILLIYEGLSTLGVDFPGIMSRNDFFVSYLLLSLQVMLIGSVFSYRQIWDGLKKLFSRQATAYSIFSVLSVVVLVYDIILLFVGVEENPPVFHFALATMLLFAIISECQALTAEMRVFKFIFSNVLKEKAEDEEISQFTLRKSVGKNSTAEKMYAGGLDHSKNIYFPLEIGAVKNCVSAIKQKNNNSNISMIAIIPSMVFSTIVGLSALLVIEKLWVAVCAALISLFITMPIMGIFASWLPFDRSSRSSVSRGYAFTGEMGMKEYSDCDILIFEDLHLFKKASPANVNLALYDATSKSVLLACLDAVYSQIGGPMGEAFANEKGKRFENCKIVRVAKSGIEAVVEHNYSVLIGSEQFMARYGISFPNVSLNNKGDQIFTLCVSINGRATARIAVRYAINEMFEMFCARLAEDKVHCSIETFDPMISTELLSRVLPKGYPKLSIIHLNAADLKDRNNKLKDTLLLEMGDEEINVVAHTSRLYLAVALSEAKRMKKVRRLIDIISIGICSLGAVLGFLMLLFNQNIFIGSINEFYVCLYWLLSIGCILTPVIYENTKNGRYSFDKFLIEKQMREERKKQKDQNKKER